VRLFEFRRKRWSRGDEGTSCTVATRLPLPIPASQRVSAPNVKRLTRRFNEVSYWVASEVVTTANQKQRTAVIVRFIELAEVSRILRLPL
jgi:hypothetical protein